VTDKNSATEIARLREELAACHELLAEQRRQMMVLEFATQALTFSLDPEQVVQTATGLAATLASPPGGSARRGVYYEISADTMRIIADSDDTGASAVGTWMPIAEHPLIPRALAAGEAVTGALDPEQAGPRARQIIARFGLKFAAYVPVRVKDAVHGVLVVSTRDKPITQDLVERLGGLGALTSLALTNALRHREAEANAVTDALTGLTNRRGFEHAVDQLASRRPFAILAIDVDSLKSINDGYGHAAGDALLMAIGQVLASVARKGETLARIGGDEFVLLISDPSEETPLMVARRMREAVAALHLPTGPASVSVGWAAGAAGDDAYLVLQQADAVLYAAKTSERTPRETQSTLVSGPAALGKGTQPLPRSDAAPDRRRRARAGR
jgi:diguanylate cyclase (GGDEF)-like protein